MREPLTWLALPRLDRDDLFPSCFYKRRPPEMPPENVIVKTLEKRDEMKRGEEKEKQSLSFQTLEQRLDDAKEPSHLSSCALRCINANTPAKISLT